MSVNPWVIAGGSILSGLGGLFGSRSAANAQEQAAKNAMRESQRLLGVQLGMTEPSRYLGYQAGGDLATLYGWGNAPFASASQLNQPTMDADAFISALRRGIPFDQLSSLGRLGTLNEREIAKLTAAGLTPQQITQLAAVPGSVGGMGGTAGTGQPSLAKFWASPDYNFRFNEGQRGVEQSAAAAGGLFSGNAGKALTNYGQGAASQEFGNYVGRLMQIAGLGSQATAQAGNAVGQTGSNLAGLQLQQGDARASGIMNGINAVTGSINNGVNLWAYLNAMRRGGGGYPPGIDPSTGFAYAG